jgi:ubiquinone/menaquinone biosynthesis C-methylase UbiE
MVSTILYICIFLVSICIIYNIIIKLYFRQQNNDSICYNFLKRMINDVSEGNNFMNYGLWFDNTETLLDANKNLVNFVFNKSELEHKQNMKILDVGCGYGEQDIEWSKKLDKSCQIKAIDISEEQINYVISKKSDIMFEVCDVKDICLKYKDELFDVIFSLESAFHYQDREQFFKNANNLLNSEGKFIITDIMLKNDYNETNLIDKFFIYFFSDFLYIPKQNLISANEWDKQLSSNFIIEESIDITDKTFKPYYSYFMNSYIKNKNLPQFIGNMLTSFFCENQPFSYKIVVCRKRLDSNL